MSDLTDVLERAERAVASLPMPFEGLDGLRRYQARRRRHNRIVAGAVALLVAAGGTVGTEALFRALHNAQPQHPIGRTNPPPSPLPSGVPTGQISQRLMGGSPAQRLGAFWFGMKDENSCLSVGPIAIGPSWTFQDRGHDCLSALGSAQMRVGQARGAVHRDGDLGPSTQFNAVYGLVTPAAVRIDMAWSTGETVSVRAVKGRFFLVWSGSAWPVRATAYSTDGKRLSAVGLTPP